ncbi:MAG: dihydrodipicolinate synthase family protein [SAR202 cluster bacterium]|jgi:dihydrodipicolinate synthase/N-acetylneuraminate lyase|nr:dihydrodipicolinate synthase family protein [SAR202 cluster bacterium]MDP6299783.1 dihydrodipicolinate synthase family protein [SAR202 cluster bacterium]MDP7102518.1 dihydrodipicolinate synthase family protein [SAR202 cluster bacterium]MDP7223848.1 dihydrodipicolinate synthase family protein [SAR202 cluster bacterium]MDP7413785.1 dihydrodipicolinate synthase family protein [SAR202 cluster bacterium]|tara:strand:- start:2213 stop:3094 length:882 start_codon:yes stop_codon:yes gene_type:complete
MPILISDPIVVAPTPTPFDSDDRVDHDALSRNIERWLATPLSGFVLGTANGEELALSDQEKVDIVRTVADASGGAKFIIAGIDVPSSAETLRLAEAYAEADADMVRVRIPRQKSPAEVEAYFDAVIPGSPVPVVIIHQTFTGVPAASPELIGELCARDNVFGYITNHDIRYEGRVRLYVPESRRFWICNGGLLLPGTLMGANGACMWLGNVAPALCTDVIGHGVAGRFEEGMALQRTATRLDAAIGNHGTAGVKAALGLLGFEGMAPRRPRRSLDGSEVNSIRAVLEETGLVS